MVKAIRGCVAVILRENNVLIKNLVHMHMLNYGASFPRSKGRQHQNGTGTKRESQYLANGCLAC